MNLYFFRVFLYILKSVLKGKFEAPGSSKAVKREPSENREPSSGRGCRGVHFLSLPNCSHMESAYAISEEIPAASSRAAGSTRSRAMRHH